MQRRMSTAVSSKRLSLSSFLPILVVGLAPVLMVLVPWDFGTDMTSYRGFMRGLSLTVPLVEILFILLASTRGFSLFAAIRALPELSKIGAAAFLLTTIAGTMLSAKVPIFSLIGIGKIVIHALFFLSLLHEVAKGGRKWRRALWLAIGCGVLGYCLLWLANIVAYQPTGDDWVGLVPGIPNVRGIGFFGLAGFFAGYCVYATAGGFNHPKIAHAVGVAISVVALVLIIWTGSRGGMLAIVSGTIFAFLFAPALRRSIAGFFGSALILAVLASYALPIVNENYGLMRMISSSSIIVDGGNPSAGRTQIWAGTIQKIMERPVLGWGIEQFAVSGPEETLGYKQPHNMILQILFSVGFLGGLATLMMLLPIALRVVFDLSQPEHVAAWGYITGTIVFGLYDAAFYYTYPVMIFLIAAAIILTPEKPSIASDRSS